MVVRSVVYISLAAFGLALLVGQAAAGTSMGEFLPPALGLLIYLALGGLIIFRRNSHITGWLLVLLGICVTLADGISRQPWATPTIIAWISSWGWTAVFALFAALSLTFPTGRPPDGSGPMAKVGRWALFALPLLTLAAMTSELVESETIGDVTNPVGILPSWLTYPVLLTVVAILLGAIVSLFVKRRRASGAERAQLTWVVFGLGIFAVVLTLTLLYVFGSVALGAGDPGDGAWAPTFLAMLLFPTTFGVAILRFRLFEIDKIISRTLSYTIVAALLGVSFFVVVAALASIGPGSDSWRVAGSTLVVAALFNPVRRRVQSVVDRRFNRSRFDAARVAEAFMNAIRNETDPATIVDGWMGVVIQTLQPSAISTWIQPKIGSSPYDATRQ